MRGDNLIFGLIDFCRVIIVIYGLELYHIIFSDLEWFLIDFSHRFWYFKMGHSKVIITFY